MATITNNASACPFLESEGGVPVCGWHAVRAGGVWLNSTAVVVPGGGDGGGDALALSARGAAVGAVVDATQYGFAAWPVVFFRNEAGLPVTPWNNTI